MTSRVPCDKSRASKYAGGRALVQARTEVGDISRFDSMVNGSDWCEFFGMVKYRFGSKHPTTLQPHA